MRRFILMLVVGVCVFGVAAPAGAHPTKAGGCNPALDGHGPGDPTAVNPATGGEYWLTPSFVSISGGTGYVVLDGENRVAAVSNADGTSQARMSEGGACVSAGGQTQKVGDP